MTTTTDNSALRPCRHMETMVSALSDGSLKGFALWFTRLHVAGCRRCAAALQAFNLLRQRLRGLADSKAVIGIPDDRRVDLDRALDRIDRSRK